MSKKFLSGINVTGTATLNTVANAGLDTDKFLVLDAAGNVDFRTGDELKADIGADVVSRIEHEVKLGEAMTIGTPVYVGVDLNAGTNMTVYKATNATEAGSSKTLGLIASSGITNDLVEVVTEGLLAGLNTSTATKGDPVWLGVNGALLFGLANKPVAPAHMVFLGIVTRVQSNNGEIFVKVQNGFEMNEIHNYLQGSVQNNEVIVYESATSLYKPKSIPTILGYTPADDSLVVKLSGTQTITGAKTFSSLVTVNNKIYLQTDPLNSTGVYLQSYSSNEFTIGATNGASTYYSTFILPYSERYYTLPNADGTLALTSDIPSLSGYVPTSRTITINGTAYDLSADRSWTITTDASARSILRYVATANQTTFTISGGYTPGLTDVYRNGVKLDNSTDFTATNGTTIVLTNGASVNDVIEVYRYQTAFLANNALRTVTEFIATAGQTTFNVTYNSGLVDVFYNGSKLLSTEYTAGNGTSIVLNFPCNVNDTLEVHAYSYQVGAFTGQAQLNGTGFVKVLGTTVTYDNSTYLTTASASSTYLPLSGGTLTGALSGTSATFSSNVQLTGDGYVYGNATAGSGTIRAGIRFNSTDQELKFFTADAGRLTIASSGNVGIGTTSPAATLHLNALNTAFRGQLSIQSTDFTQITFYKGATTSTDLIAQIYSEATGNYDLRVNNSSSTGALIFGTNSGTERMRITSGGNVGIGGTSPAAKLDVFGNIRLRRGDDSTQYMDFYAASGNGYIEGVNSAHSTYQALVFRSGNNTGSVERMRISETGNVGIGTSSPLSKLHVNGTMQVGYVDASNTAMEFYWNGASSYGRIQTYSSSALALNPLGNNVGIGTSSPSGKLHVYNASGPSLIFNQNYNGVNSIWNASDGGTTFFGNISNHPLQFITNDSIRMTISIGGTTIVGNDSDILVLKALSNTNKQVLIGYNGGSDYGRIQAVFQGNSYRPLYLNNDGGQVYANGTNGFGLVNTTASDIRIKKNIVSIDNALDKVMSLRGVFYDFNENNELGLSVPFGKTRVGLIAQEVESILPEAVLDSEDETLPKSVDYAGMVGLLVKAIQEQQAQIEELKALIAAK